MAVSTQQRYTAEHNGQAGEYARRFGWQVIDHRPQSGEFRVVMSGSKGQAQRWARDLNAR